MFTWYQYFYYKITFNFKFSEYYVTKIKNCTHFYLNTTLFSDFRFNDKIEFLTLLKQNR